MFQLLLQSDPIDWLFNIGLAVVAGIILRYQGNAFGLRRPADECRERRQAESDDAPAIEGAMPSPKPPPVSPPRPSAPPRDLPPAQPRPPVANAGLCMIIAARSDRAAIADAIDADPGFNHLPPSPLPKAAVIRGLLPRRLPN